MVAATESVAAGNLDCVLAIDSQDELGQLAVAFNRMTQDLKSSHEQLEQRVEQAEINRNESERMVAELQELNQVTQRGAAGRRSGERGQEPVPGQHEP